MTQPEASNSHVLNGNTPAQPDFELRDEHTIFLLRPVTEAAHEWVANSIPQDSTEWCGGIVIEHRYIWRILDAIDDEQLTVGPWPNWEGPR
jgi:hypothetical protein